MKNLIPTYYQKDLFALDINKLLALKVKIVFLDLDNTLVSPYVQVPDEKAIEFINNLKQHFKVIILSNNHEDRVKLFCLDLGVDYVYEVKKPNIKRLKAHLDENKIDVNDCISIGDQVMTDIYLANKLKIKSILVDARTKDDEPITFFPRLLDKHYRKKFQKKGLLRDL